MVPKDSGTDAGCMENMVSQRYQNSPNLRRREGPVLRRPSVSEEIRLACIKGDLAIVQRLIENGRVNVNSFLDDGWSPLMIAASAARPVVLEYLLSKDADPNLARKDNFTALMAATGSSQLRSADILSCVIALIGSGSSINAKDNSGMTPLGYAVKENRCEVVKCLIDAGGKVDSLDRNGRNCLFYAAEKGYGRMARLLLERGANIDIVDKNGWMVCEQAVERGHTKLGELLFRVRESRWRPGKELILMTSFKDVPEPASCYAESDADTNGEGIVNVLTNIQTQVKCLSNLINSVRLRMVQDVTTKEIEVEPGKMHELVVFARSMEKSCAILTNQVSSLNLLVNDETTTTSQIEASFPESRETLCPYGWGYFTSSSLPPSNSTCDSTSKNQPTPPQYRKEERGRWDAMLAGAAGFFLFYYFAPHFRGKLATMRVWHL